MLLLTVFGSMVFGKEIAEMNATSSNERGNQLRAEIEVIYRQLKDTKKLVGGHKGNDIGDVVRKYIPIGTSFEDGENCLRSAGFTVHPRPNLNATGNRPDKYHVSAFIDSMDRGNTYNIQVIVSLGPKVPGDYSAIDQISAGIFYSSL